MDLTNQAAPDFKLKANTGEEIGLADFRGKQNVLLIFYPFDFSSVCSMQLPEYSGQKETFAASNTVILGVNRDSLHTHKAWAREYGIEVPLLSDMTGAVARAYGVWLEDKGHNKRATFLIDKSGTVVVQHVENATGDFTLHADEVLEKVRSLPA